MPTLRFRGKSLFFTQVKPESAGKSSATFIFIHGLGSSHSFYTPVITQLASNGHSCVAFDTHGSGLSEFLLTQPPPSIESIVQDVEDVMQNLEISPDQAIVVGHSMGGIVVSELASKLNLRGAVLIGPVLPKPALGQVFKARIETVKQQGMEAMADTIPTAATGSKASPTHKAFIRALILSQQPNGYNALCNAIAEAKRPNYVDAHCPVLVLAGEEDKTSPLADAQVMIEEWGCEPNRKSIQVLSGVGHWHCIEAAEEVGRSILEFVSK